MNKRIKIFRIPNELWDELGLDDPDVYRRVLCAFYLGRGPEYARELVNRFPDDREVTELLRVAPLLGLSNQDRIEKR